MAFSAADLQKRHHLEGAPDPFPSLVENAPVKAKASKQAQALDTDSQDAFPSLAPSASTPSLPAKSAWGAGPRIKPVVSKAPVFSDTVTLTSIDLSNTGKDGKTATMGEILKQVMSKYKVKIEASGNQKTNQTTFHMKAESEKDLDKAKRSLLALLSPVISLVIHAPASTIASLIGVKGATLKQIRDQTGVRVDIPPKDTLTVPNGTNGASSGRATPTGHDDDDEEPTVPVTITGPQPLAYEAQNMLNQIISSKIRTSTQRVRDIPAHVLPFILTRKAQFEAVAEPDTVTLILNARDITVSGEREAVTKVVDAIKKGVETLNTSLNPVKISIPRRQHRLLTGKATDEILLENKCAILVSPPEEMSEEVTVWGQPNDLPGALGAVMIKANSQHIHEFPLPGPIKLSKQLLTYITRINYPKTLSEGRDVSVYTPHPSVIDKSSTLSLDIVGPKSDVDDVVRKISELLGKLIGGTRDITVDWLVHRIIQGKHAKKLKQYHEAHNVLVYFPPEDAEKSEILLVYDPLSPNASLSPDDKKKHLDDVSKELQKIAKDAADVKSHTLSIEKRWHDAVVGQGGTTLNAIIGEDKALSIKVGSEVGDASTEDVILIRGASVDVDRAVKEILQIIENAKNDEIINSFSTEFEVDREYVGRIVGAQGSGVNKLRDQLGVKVDVSDDFDEKDKDSSRKKKATHQKSKVKITGRKENVEDAKKRILAQVERLADETSEILKIPSQYHASLIGQSGKYAIRLEERYSVKITFPRQNAENGEGKTREQLKPDEVLVKGGRKGVAQTRNELLEALEFEKDNNNVINFAVPSRSVARILGKGGVSINEIKADTNTKIDIDRTEDADTTNIAITGSKKDIAAAKVAILAISEQVHEETTVTLNIDQKYHRSLIGAGGQGLKDLVSRSGGPSDPKIQAGLVRFPRQGEASDEVKLRGEPKLVEKIKAELEKSVSVLKDRVILAVEVPAAQHRILIGRGGQNLTELQNRNNVQVQFPGSRSYHQVGEAANAADLKDANPADIVKVSGPQAACEKAIEELKAQIRAPAPEGVTATISVPLKYYHAISQQGQLYRTLRNLGVQVEQSVQPKKPTVPSPPGNGDAATARIDEDDSATAADIKWEITTNHQDTEGESEWTLKGRDQEALDKAQKIIKDAITHAEGQSHVGFLTLADRSAFPRIVGAKGANVARLRNETGADITVGKEDNTIVIVGSETSLEAAKAAILKTISDNSKGRFGRRQD